MFPVTGQEMISTPMDAQVIGKSYNATTTVPAHGTRVAVCVKIFHFEIESFQLVQQHEAVRPDAETSVTDPFDFFTGDAGETPAAVIHQDKVITGSLVFTKWH